MYVRTYVGGDDNPCCHLKLWLEWSSCEWGGDWVKGHLPWSSSVLKSEEYDGSIDNMISTNSSGSWKLCFLWTGQRILDNSINLSSAVGEKLADNFFHVLPAPLSQALLSMSCGTNHTEELTQNSFRSEYGFSWYGRRQFWEAHL